MARSDGGQCLPRAPELASNTQRRMLLLIAVITGFLGAGKTVGVRPSRSRRFGPWPLGMADLPAAVACMLGRPTRCHAFDAHPHAAFACADAGQPHPEQQAGPQGGHQLWLHACMLASPQHWWTWAAPQNFRLWTTWSAMHHTHYSAATHVHATGGSD